MSATYNLADNAPGSPQTVALTGTATAASTMTLAFSTTSVTFPTTKVGATATAQVVTLKNTGTAAVKLGAVSFTGANASSFLQSATNCPGTVAAGGSCTINLEFKPNAAGNLMATYSLADNATNSPQTISLKGTAQ